MFLYYFLKRSHKNVFTSARAGAHVIVIRCGKSFTSVNYAYNYGFNTPTCNKTVSMYENTR